MNRTLAVLVVFLFFPVVASVAADGAVSFSIRFFDKKVYYTDSEIRIKATISNGTPQTFRFKLAENKAFSLRFDVKTLSNRSFDASPVLLRTESSNQSVFYREMALQAGEEYSFDILLRDFTDIATSGTFRVNADFYPELVRDKDSSPPLRSNILELSVRPGAGIAPVQDRIETESREIIKAQKIPPDEVVRRVLIARQKERWNEYFLYLDLEKMISRNSERKKQYDLASDEARARIREQYREELMKKTIDREISLVPAWFDVIETQYQAARGTVKVTEKFDSFLEESIRGNFYLVKEYIYELQKRDDIWYITGYSVTNKGTEAKPAGQ